MPTRPVADMLAIPLGQLVEVLGARWWLVPASPRDGGKRWFVTGDPAQVAIGQHGRDPSAFLLARPVRGGWPSISPVVAGGPSGGAAPAGGSRHPSRFQRSLGTCMACASAPHGVVH